MNRPQTGRSHDLIPSSDKFNRRFHSPCLFDIGACLQEKGQIYQALIVTPGRTDFAHTDVILYFTPVRIRSPTPKTNSDVIKAKICKIFLGDTGW